MKDNGKGDERTNQLPAGFDATERGNIYLTLDDWHLAWCRCGDGVWLEVGICPGKYPATSVTTFRATDEELAAHIREQCEGWDVWRLDLDGVEMTGGDDGGIAGPADGEGD